MAGRRIKNSGFANQQSRLILCGSNGAYGAIKTGEYALNCLLGSIVEISVTRRTAARRMFTRIKIMDTKMSTIIASTASTKTKTDTAAMTVSVTQNRLNAQKEAGAQARASAVQFAVEVRQNIIGLWLLS